MLLKKLLSAGHLGIDRTEIVRLALIALAAFAISPRAAHAIHDKDNQGHYTKPTEHDPPDKEVPGFLINLGPTGARATLAENSFVVKYIFKDSPATGKLHLDDTIVGAFGKPFSKHTFGGGPHGYEGPIMDLGLAIERAEGKDGKLVLNVARESKEIEVKIDLELLGAFSPSYPFDCKKSQLIRAGALKYLADQSAAHGGNAHSRCAVALALMTSDNSAQQAVGKSMALKWASEKPDSNTWTWGLSYEAITLCEYHLLTKDPAVLPAIKVLVGMLEKAQYQGKILVWGPTGDKALEKIEYPRVDAAQQLYDGGFGHAPYVSGVGKNGYGPMQYTTILAVTAWQLAARCGVTVDPDRVKRSIDFIHRGTNMAGYVAYGGEFTLNAGLVDSVKWKSSTSGDNYVGRVGCALIAHKLSPEIPDAASYIDEYRGYMKKAYKSMPDGHADSNLGIFWGLMGAAASHDNGVLRTILDYHKAWFNMMRCYDGSFVLLPGRDYADDGYYMASRYHPTATMALTLGLSYPQLRIQGVELSLPGVNPAALKGKMDTAYKAIVNRNFREAAAALAKPKPEDKDLADKLMSQVDAEWQKAIAELEKIESSGDILRLDEEVAKQRAQFKGVEGFDQKIKRFEEGLRQNPWKKELLLGKQYLFQLNALKRIQAATGPKPPVLAPLVALEKFSQENPDSLYGKWAAAVVKDYRANGAVNVSANGQPIEAEAKTATTTTPEKK